MSCYAKGGIPTPENIGLTLSPFPLLLPTISLYQAPCRYIQTTNNSFIAWNIYKFAWYSCKKVASTTILSCQIPMDGKMKLNWRHTKMIKLMDEKPWFSGKQREEEEENRKQKQIFIIEELTRKRGRLWLFVIQSWHSRTSLSTALNHEKKRRPLFEHAIHLTFISCW